MKYFFAALGSYSIYTYNCSFFCLLTFYHLKVFTCYLFNLFLNVVVSCLKCGKGSYRNNPFRASIDYAIDQGASHEVLTKNILCYCFKCQIPVENTVFPNLKFMKLLCLAEKEFILRNKNGTILIKSCQYAGYCIFCFICLNCVQVFLFISADIQRSCLILSCLQ